MNSDEQEAWADDAWEWYVENAGVVMRVCGELARGDAHRFDDAWEACVLRLPGLLRTYDPTRGASLATYVGDSLRRYLRKSPTLGDRRRRETRRLDDDPPAGRRDTDDAEAVQYILDRVGEDDARVLRLRFLEGLTVAETAWELDVSKSAACKAIRAALERARRVKHAR